MLELAEQAGLSTGVISTARVTHATPAACFAHSPDRDWEGDSDLPPVANEAGFPDTRAGRVTFHGVREQNVIFHVMMEALRLSSKRSARSW